MVVLLLCKRRRASEKSKNMSECRHHTIYFILFDCEVYLCGIQSFQYPLCSFLLEISWKRQCQYQETTHAWIHSVKSVRRNWPCFWQESRCHVFRALHSRSIFQKALTVFASSRDELNVKCFSLGTAWGMSFASLRLAATERGGERDWRSSSVRYCRPQVRICGRLSCGRLHWSTVNTRYRHALGTSKMCVCNVAIALQAHLLGQISL